jgi:outer membrane scaffolding protein for murein synthesis (MipA/OmpV family)
VGHAADWIVTVGGRLSVGPPYEGADHDVIAPTPSFSVRRADRPYRFTPPDGGSTVALISTRLLDAGPMVRFRYDRGDSGKLEGFRRIKFAAEPGIFADVWPTDWLRGRIEARRGVTGHQGYVGDAGFDVIHTGRKWDLSIGPRIGYGDRKYMDTYFGVTPQEAARSPFVKTPYEPGGGQRYAGLEAAYSYHLSHRWRANVDFGYHRLAHKAADSPVVRFAGSPNQYSASAGFSYSFGIGLGRKRAPAATP